MYVLDTNVLLQDPESIFSFENSAQVFPSWHLKSLIRLKQNLRSADLIAEK